jgi:hypothetical protein
LCTTNKNGRFIERGIYQEHLESNAERVNQNPEYYRLRQQITEHQFGTLKRQWGFTHTMVRGKEHVLSEVYLCFSVYNLIRAFSILGPELLKSRLESLTQEILAHIGSILASLRLLNFETVKVTLHSHPNFKAA